jgi:UDP-3-O-[3-hydroxymyristoyl] N-acetylglucosamine deacetylase / 3-hydroxyacyl-[acyl-carrier-protein] dehydratase
MTSPAVSIGLARPQRTILAEIGLEGLALFSGKLARLRLLPGEANAGIVFRRVDLPGRPSARVCPGNLAPSHRNTALRVGNGTVHLVEHLLAAAAGVGVDNLVVEIDADEVPCLDGSTLPFYRALTQAGVVSQNVPVQEVVLDESVEVAADDSRLTAHPSTGGLSVEYTLDYGERFLRRQSVSFTLESATFGREVAPARTFVLRPEIEKFRQAGLGGGATSENVVIVEEDGSSPTPLRFPDECARHKVLDLLGDVQFLGAPLRARIVAYKAGHSLNALLVRRIADTLCAKAGGPAGRIAL